MKCLDCKHGIPEKRKVTVSLDKNNCTEAIKDVPALVCPVCGSYFLNKSLTEKVTEARNGVLKNGTEVEIIRLKAA